MNILHLKYAAEIAKTGSLNKAAENLYMGQPNLSRAIKELEANLGITVFERSAKGMVPTPEGREFLGYAEKILAQIDEVEAIYKSGIHPKQRFSISVPRASYISEAFTSFTNTLNPTFPVEISYKETNAMRAINNILTSDYKLGIVRYADLHDRYFRDMLDEKGLLGEVVAEFDMRLLMSRKHPLAERDEIFAADLMPFTEVAHADLFVPSVPATTVRKEAQPIEIERTIYVFERASQFELLSGNTQTFMWVSPIPNEQLKRYDLVEKQCADTKRAFTDLLIYRKDYRLSELDRRFITELCASKRRYIES